MINFSLQQMAKELHATFIGLDAEISAVSTDTRTIDQGSLFIALVGERFDGHQFCEQAMLNGASGIVVEHALPLDIPQLVVTNTKQALGDISAWVHQQSTCKTIALTGSCGKTTVKEMLAAILQQRGSVLATAGNFNNDIGVPLTLLRRELKQDYAVIELGANHLNEIAYTTQLVKPSIALVNNVAAAHLEGFGSIDGVKRAKGEIYQGLNSGDTAVVNMDSNGLEFWHDALADKKVVTFSQQNPKANFYASNIELDELGFATFCLHTPLGDITVTLTLVGAHNVSNAVATAAIAQNAGASLTEIKHGLANMTNVSGRVEVIELAKNVRLIDDSYNASVPAMKAAVDLLANYQGQRWLILGFMAELGQESLELHRQVGQHAAPFDFEHVLTFGEDTKVISDICHGTHFESHEAMVTYIEQHLNNNSNSTHTLLVKGANSAGMSKIVAALKEIL